MALFPGALTLVLACSDNPAGLATEQPPVAASVTAGGPQVLKGEIGPGALYGLYLPADWNGELVIYAHGFRPTAWPIVLPDSADPTGDPRYAALRDSLLERGFALAWSSYSENGFAHQDGVIRTRQLLGIFTSRLARPERTYLWGLSTGGAVVLQLAQQNPERSTVC
jgi:hypothetical protein